MDLKHVVSEYFDRDAAPYLDAYERKIRDFRSSILQTRRGEVLRLVDQTPGRVLDIGSGPGVFTGELLKRGAECWVVDCSRNMLAAARMQGPDQNGRGRVRFGIADVDSLPFRDASFRTVLCIGVLQYLSKEEQALSELSRVTRPGGLVVIALPNLLSPLNWLHRGVVSVVRFVGKLLLRLGVSPRDPDRRLTFRADIPNRWFAPSSLARKCRERGLRAKTITYHGFHPPFLPDWTFPVLGPLGHWLQERLGRSPFGWWGRDVIVSLVKER
jgi:ubiquinone/menaquinone biosynthesis C-methylase UbiE